MDVRQIICVFLVLSFFSVVSLAEIPEVERMGFFASRKSSPALYKKPFSELSSQKQWWVRMHGLRLAPLDPAVWGIAKRDQTINRRFVPIRPYYLLASQQDSFRLQSIDLNFRFKKTSPREMETHPHQKDPVFDIRPGGKLFQTQLGVLPKIEERNYVIRFSATPALRSGIYYETPRTLTPLVLSPAKPLLTATVYKVQMSVSAGGVSVRLNGKDFLKLKQAGIDQGFVSLLTGWSPIQMQSLLINGSITKNGKQKGIELSGLVPTRLPVEKEKSVKKAKKTKQNAKKEKVS